MCTVSIIPLKHPDNPEQIVGLRLVTNRDEQRTRSAALPPAWYDLEPSPFRAVHPMDADAGGTWVAATTSGLVLCLLNANPRPYPALPPAQEIISRGMIIPALMGSRDAASAARGVSSLELDRYAPFTLLAADLGEQAEQGPEARGGLAARRAGGTATLARAGSRVTTRVFQVRWDRDRLVEQELGAAPVCVASSGLGDHVVGERLPLFDRMVARESASDDTCDERQDKFHRHQWSDRRHVSVLMSREDARTVSITTVELMSAREGMPATVTMTYEPVADSRVKRALAWGFRRPVTHQAPVVTTGN